MVGLLGREHTLGSVSAQFTGLVAIVEIMREPTRYPQCPKVKHPDGFEVARFALVRYDVPARDSVVQARM